MTKTVISPIGDHHLTKGKSYDVVSDEGEAFRIVNDHGNEIYCLYKGCAHLGGADWIAGPELRNDQMIVVNLGWSAKLVLELTDDNLKLARQLCQLPVHDDMWIENKEVFFHKTDPVTATIRSVYLSDETYSEYKDRTEAEAKVSAMAEAAE